MFCCFVDKKFVFVLVIAHFPINFFLAWFFILFLCGLAITLQLVVILKHEIKTHFYLTATAGSTTATAEG